MSFAKAYPQLRYKPAGVSVRCSHFQFWPRLVQLESRLAYFSWPLVIGFLRPFMWRPSCGSQTC